MLQGYGVILISHRGNLHGKASKENNPKRLKEILNQVYNIEVDVWLVKDRLFLGHDKPEYEVNLKFLQNEKFWCHAKNLAALEFMLLNNIHCFWHQEDDYTITSKGYIWTYPGKPVCKKSIIVCKTLEDTMRYCKMDIAGVCSDYVEKLK
jgi:hypothetical protein